MLDFVQLLGHVWLAYVGIGTGGGCADAVNRSGHGWGQLSGRTLSERPIVADNRKLFFFVQSAIHVLHLDLLLLNRKGRFFVIILLLLGRIL